METTPQKIDEASTRREIDRRLNNSLASLDHDLLEKQALEQHPPMYRQTVPVSEEVRLAQVNAIKMSRQPKRSRKTLP